MKRRHRRHGVTTRTVVDGSINAAEHTMEPTSPSQIAEEFVRNNLSVVKDSGIPRDVVVGMVANNLALKKMVAEKYGLEAARQIIRPVGNTDNFIETPFGKLHVKVMDFLQAIPPSDIGVNPKQWGL